MNPRYIIKQRYIPGRGGGDQVIEYYIYDTKEKRPAIGYTGSTWKPAIEKLLIFLNKV